MTSSLAETRDRQAAARWLLALLLSWATSTAAQSPSDGPPSESDCFLGVVLAPRTVDLVSRTSGRLTEVRVGVGDRVEEAEGVAIVVQEDLRHRIEAERAALRAARAQRERREVGRSRAEAALRRKEALRREGLTPQAAVEETHFLLQEAVAELKAAQAAEDMASARLRQLEHEEIQAEIKAPFAGTVTHLHLDAGSVIAAGTPLLRVISGDGLFVRFAVPPEASPELTAGRTVSVEVEGDGTIVHGIVEHVAPEIDTPSQMIFSEARLLPVSAISSVSPGMVVRVSRPTDTRSPPQRSRGWSEHGRGCLSNPAEHHGISY